MNVLARRTLTTGTAVMIVVGLTSACSSSRPRPGPVPAGTHVAATAGSGVQLVSDVRPPAPLPTRAAILGLAVREHAGSANNVTLSPASLAIALTMLDLGAAGETECQISDVLAMSGATPATQAELWAGLSAQWQAASTTGRIALQSANSLWLEDGFPLKPTYLDNLARYFETGVWQVDFDRHPSQAARAIDAWVTKQTNGRITSIFKPGDFDPSTALVLADALYFKAAWAEPFESQDTTGAPFISTGGRRIPTQFMHSTEPARGVRTATYQAVELPYAGGRFVADAIMPARGSLSDFVTGLDQGGLATLVTRLTRPSNVALPKFEFSSTTNLNATLKAMGMTDAFDNADFSAMNGGGGALWVKTVRQKTYLQVDEAGTEAAAATGIQVEATSGAANPILSITFDHPFLFLIRDTTTAAILFESEIQNPEG
jgi:serpin B